MSNRTQTALQETGSNDTARPEAILRIGAVENRTGLKRSTIYKYIALGGGAFPSPVDLLGNGRCVGWRESDIEHWLHSRAAVKPIGSIAA